jgi:DNA invertase Pin-like site-specific DNA recombinase
MSEHSKITASHRSRTAVIYVRQSTLAQLERNTESTERQYDLVERAVALGWPREAITVIDADLGVSGSALGQREGFESLVAEVALGQVGIIFALEVSRPARDNTAWYRLLDLAGAYDTLVADADGVYHPGLFNDRLVLGMKGIMSEAELHVLRARLQGGIRNKAARGELRTGLPVGLVWGETDGEIRLHPDEAVTGVIAAVFERFAVCGSVRATWGVAARAGAALAAADRRVSARRPIRDHLGGADLPCRAHHADPPRLCRRLRLWPDTPAPLRRQRRPDARPPT